MVISSRISSKFTSDTTFNASIDSWKRSASAISVENVKNELFSIENPLNSLVSRQKRIRKASQQTSSPDSYSFDSYRGPSLVYSASQTGRVRSRIVIKIPFRLEIHQNSGSLYSSEPLQSISTNRGSRARAFSKKWFKKQSNDDTNKQNQRFLYVFTYF